MFDHDDGAPPTRSSARWVGTVAAVLLATLATAGCEPDSATPKTFNIKRSEVIGSLDDGDFRTLCEDVERWTEAHQGTLNIKKIICGIVPAIQIRRTKRGEVWMFVDGCEKEARTCYETPGLHGIVTTCERGGGACTANVGDLEQCLKERHDAYVTLLDSAPTCGGICNGPTMTALKVPASCQRVADTCPGYVFPAPPALPSLVGIPQNCITRY